MTPELDIARIDQRLLYRTYEEWDKHFKLALRINASADHHPDYYNAIYFCGMGGSGTSGEISNEILQYDGSVFSDVIKGVGRLPNSLGKRSLVIVSSVSGNTEETIAMSRLAAERDTEVICISSGGQLKEAAAKLGQKHISIPNLSLPRACLPYLVIPSLRIIEPFLHNPIDLESICSSLSKTSKNISIEQPLANNIAKQISKFLKDGFAFCYTSPYLTSSGNRFKNSLNENAKVHCAKESILEASHNEIVPFTFTNNNFVRKVMLLRWLKDDDFTDRRYKKFKSLFNEIGQPYMELVMPDPNILNAILSSIYILDYSTVFMAISNNLDPSPTPAIDILKRLPVT